MFKSDCDQLLTELRLMGIGNEAVLAAIATTPREDYVSPGCQNLAYENRAQPIDCGQTISQPYVVARMTEALLARRVPNQVLELGTGSGYQTAILAKLVPQVFTIERYKALYQQAKHRLADMSNVTLHHGDGFEGWLEHAPYEGILVTAAAAYVPPALLKQLAGSGRLILPVGDRHGQVLTLIDRDGDQFRKTTLDPVIFVPLCRGVIAD